MRPLNPIAFSCGVLAAVTACCGTGAWIQNRASTNAIQRQVVQQLDTDLAAKAATIAARLGVVGSADTDLAVEVIGGVWDANCQLMLVNDEWMVLADPSGSFNAGDRVAWIGAMPAGAAGSLANGRIGGVAGESRPACGVSIGVGYLVASVPQAVVDDRIASLVRSLVNPAWTSFLWMCAILWPALWMLLARGRRSALTDDRPLLRLEQAQEVVRSRDAIVFGLAKLTESRDPATGNHLERISAYVTVLARALRRHPKYQDIVTSTFVRRIGACSVLHDIGKVGITDSVLLKKGEFTAADKRIIQEHAMIGSQCLGEIDRRLGGSGFLKMAQQIAAAHHERWDGAGYPHGLAGEAIPLAARIVAIADVYDALVSKRIYKHSYTHEDCVEHICSGAGTQFDPQLIDVWLTVAGKFREIAERFQAHETGVPDALASEEIETIDDVLGFSGDLEHAGELAAVSGNNRHKLRLEGNEC